MFIDILLLIMGLTILYFGAEAMVKGASLIALGFGISPLVVGLTVVAFGTSAPEFVVSFSAVLQESEGISVGNIVGSNICNIALILGISALIAPLSIDASSLKREYPIMIAASLLFFGFSYDGLIDHWEGGILFLGIVGFVTYNMVLSRRLSQLSEDDDDGDDDDASNLLRNIAYLVFGIAGLTVGAHLMVEGASSIARSAGISDLVIGISIVAFGTSLPELATCAVAAVRGESDISIGNVIGSNIFNILFIMGGVPLLFTMPVDPEALRFDFPIMIAVMLIAFPIMRHQYRIGRIKGGIFLLIYVGYTVFLFVRTSS